MHLDRENPFFGLGKTLTDEQYEYIDSILNKKITFCNSPSGTGKTTIAVATAKYLYQMKKIEGLLYIFNPTEENSMGFRPGEQDKKEFEYLGPLQDALAEVGEQPDIINRMGGWVEAHSHTFYRGKNIQKRFVIIDEAQNWTRKHLKKILTRPHDNCYVVCIGHIGQIDLKDERTSGFVPYMEHFSDEPDKVGYAHLTHDFRGWLSRKADALPINHR